jgi:hypothetical protein
MTTHPHPFESAPIDQPLVYYRQGWSAKIPCIIRLVDGQPVLVTDRGGRLGALTQLPANAILEELPAQ